MADERVMRFRLGVLAIASAMVVVTLILLFGGSPGWLKDTYQVHVRFKDASGVSPGTPVRKFGIRIGRVAEVGFADDGESALVTLEIDSEIRLRSDETFCLTKGLVGDAVIEVVKKAGQANASESERRTRPTNL
ncbi:MAG TPA: MlaD family protein [Pirellulales bacterium]|nr:MlaD family protein [Pirellulales bacterium]